MAGTKESTSPHGNFKISKHQIREHHQTVKNNTKTAPETKIARHSGRQKRERRGIVSQHMSESKEQRDSKTRETEGYNTKKGRPCKGAVQGVRNPDRRATKVFAHKCDAIGVGIRSRGRIHKERSGNGLFFFSRE